VKEEEMDFEMSSFYLSTCLKWAHFMITIITYLQDEDKGGWMDGWRANRVKGQEEESV
jgi:allantoicase